MGLGKSTEQVMPSPRAIAGLHPKGQISFLDTVRQPIADRKPLRDHRFKSGQIHVEVVVHPKVLTPKVLAPKVLAPKVLTSIVSLSLLFGGVATLVAPPAPAQTKAVKSVWSAVDVNDGGCSILMPGIVDRRVKAPEVMGQATEQTLLLASQERHDAFYMVAWSDLSVSPNLDEAGQAKVLDIAKDSFLKSFNGELSDDTDLRLDGHPGKQFTMQSRIRGKQFVVRSRSFLVGSRLYHVLAAVPQQVDQSLVGSTRGFLKSFKLDPSFTAPQNIAQVTPSARVDVAPPKTQQATDAAMISAEKAEPLVKDPAAQRLF